MYLHWSISQKNKEVMARAPKIFFGRISTNRNSEIFGPTDYDEPKKSKKVPINISGKSDQNEKL